MAERSASTNLLAITVGEECGGPSDDDDSSTLLRRHSGTRAAASQGGCGEGTEQRAAEPVDVVGGRRHRRAGRPRPPRGRDAGNRRRDRQDRGDPSRLSDCLAAASACRGHARPTVVIALGRPGIPTRILPGRFGSCWTYAGSVAPGQVPPTELLDVFRVRQIAPRRASSVSPAVPWRIPSRP